MFALHERLKTDTVFIADLKLSQALLSKDARYPWLILVPRQNNLKEIHELSEPDGLTLWQEIRYSSALMEKTFQCDKVNVGALGNLVPQLHIHIIARQINDHAWPGPIWGVGESETYKNDILEERIERLKTEFEKSSIQHALT